MLQGALAWGVNVLPHLVLLALYMIAGGLATRLWAVRSIAGRDSEKAAPTPMETFLWRLTAVGFAVLLLWLIVAR
ncbi:MAG: hypothetical protein AAGA92_07985 [Planctomycetota bacterium]